VLIILLAFLNVVEIVVGISSKYCLMLMFKCEMGFKACLAYLKKGKKISTPTYFEIFSFYPYFTSMF
jgi:hypothetical protein